MVLLSNRLTTVALGYYVKEQLDKKCISTERVANLLDCKVSDVDMFLRGDAFASFRQIQKLASLFGLSVSELLRDAAVNYSAIELPSIKRRGLTLDSPRA